MYKNKKVLGVVPARGGSKGLPGKNIISLLGKPLIAWTIEAAKESQYLDRLIVSTDDENIAQVALEYGAEVPFMRPSSLASDESKTIDVLLHVLSQCRGFGEEYDYLVLLEPTSPLRETCDIDNAISKLIDDQTGAESIVGVSRVEAAHPAFDVSITKDGLIKPYLGSFSFAGRRQDISELYYFEGTIYVSTISALESKLGFYHDKTLAYIVPRWKALEIDDILDLICADAILKNKNTITEV